MLATKPRRTGNVIPVYIVVFLHVGNKKVRRRRQDLVSASPQALPKGKYFTCLHGKCCNRDTMLSHGVDWVIDEFTYHERGKRQAYGARKQNRPAKIKYVETGARMIEVK